jgi:TetR/AcrR family transcriptional repressor of nem operon
MEAAQSQSVLEQKGAALAHPLLSYAESLSAQIALAKRKGERTRLRLKAAAARLLGEVGYRDLRVSDIHEDADVSNALFYVYFKNKEEISKEVLDGFLAFLEGFPERERPPETRFGSIAHGNLRYAQMFQANAGLMRCVFQFTDEFPEFAAKWHAWNARWRERTTRALLRQRDIALKDRVEIDVAVAALGSMVDALLRLAFIESEPTIAGTRYASNPAALAELLTKLWLRALFAPDPEDGPARN